MAPSSESFDSPPPPYHNAVSTNPEPYLPAAPSVDADILPEPRLTPPPPPDTSLELQAQLWLVLLPSMGLLLLGLFELIAIADATIAAEYWASTCRGLVFTATAVTGLYGIFTRNLRLIELYVKLVAVSMLVHFIFALAVYIRAQTPEEQVVLMEESDAFAEDVEGSSTEGLVSALIMEVLYCAAYLCCGMSFARQMRAEYDAHAVDVEWAAPVSGTGLDGMDDETSFASSRYYIGDEVSPPSSEYPPTSREPSLALDSESSASGSSNGDDDPFSGGATKPSRRGAGAGAARAKRRQR